MCVYVCGYAGTAGHTELQCSFRRGVSKVESAMRTETFDCKPMVLVYLLQTHNEAHPLLKTNSACTALHIAERGEFGPARLFLPLHPQAE